MDPFHEPWKGETKLVVGIDIGVTHARVSFALISCGERKMIQRVIRWPGQEGQNQQSKVPTLVWYTTDKKAVAFGDEALSHEIQEQAEDNRWLLAKHFKSHLYPDEMKIKHNIEPNPLPPGVSLLRVYSDFLGYILKHTKSHFQDCVLDGKLIWERYYPAMDVVIAHPNGWGNAEQTFLTSAAVAAGFTTTEQAPSKIHFVTEPEALAYFCVYNLGLWSALQVGSNFIVYYSENAEIQITSYTAATILPALKLRELHHSTSVEAGVRPVSEALEQYIQDILTRAHLDPELVDLYTNHGVEDFELACRSFTDIHAEVAVNLGSGANIPASGIRRGRMKLPGAMVRSLFDLRIDEIKALIGPRIKDMNISFIFPMGKFTGIQYLSQAFGQYCNLLDCQALFPNSGSIDPFISDGAIVWRIVDDANERRFRKSFGFETSVQFDRNLSEHDGRLVTTSASGSKIIRGEWAEIAGKHAPYDQNAVFTKSVSLTFPTSRPEPREFELTLYSYSGGGKPLWMRDKQGRLLDGFQGWMTLSVDLMKLSGAVESRIGAYGIINWHLEFDICLQFGDIGLSVNIRWKEKEEIRTAPVTIVLHYQ